jgi:hypothetical protein
MEIHDSDPLMDSSIKIIRHIEQVFEPYRLMFREVMGVKEQIVPQCFWKEQENGKND